MLSVPVSKAEQEFRIDLSSDEARPTDGIISGPAPQTPTAHDKHANLPFYAMPMRYHQQNRCPMSPPIVRCSKPL